MSEDLLPCPWCKTSAHEQEWTTFNGPRECVEVQCDGCERSVRGIDAIAAWNALPRTQATPSDREKGLELACKEVLATPSIGALRDAAAVDTIRIVRSALATARVQAAPSDRGRRLEEWYQAVLWEEEVSNLYHDLNLLPIYVAWDEVNNIILAAFQATKDARAALADTTNNNGG